MAQEISEIEKVLQEIGFPEGFPSSECITLGCVDIYECKAVGLCPYLTDEQKEKLESIGYKRSINF